MHPSPDFPPPAPSPNIHASWESPPLMALPWDSLRPVGQQQTHLLVGATPTRLFGDLQGQPVLGSERLPASHTPSPASWARGPPCPRGANGSHVTLLRPRRAGWPPCPLGLPQQGGTRWKLEGVKGSGPEPFGATSQPRGAVREPRTAEVLSATARVAPRASSVHPASTNPRGREGVLDGAVAATAHTWRAACLHRALPGIVATSLPRASVSPRVRRGWQSLPCDWPSS